MVKIHGKCNPADLMTKSLSQQDMESHLRALWVEFRMGRADVAPELHMIVHEAKKGKKEWRRQGKKVRDYWVEFEGELRRIHIKPRKTLFTPNDIDAASCPRAWNALRASRVTGGVLADGTPFKREDDWTVPANAHKTSQQKWTGTTVFHQLIGGVSV